MLRPERRPHPRPLCGRGVRMLKEEAEHLARGVGSAGIGVGAGRAPTGPGVAATVNHPLLENGLAVTGRVQGPAVGMPPGTWPPSVLACRPTAAAAPAWAIT